MSRVTAGYNSDRGPCVDRGNSDVFGAASRGLDHSRSHVGGKTHVFYYYLCARAFASTTRVQRRLMTTNTSIRVRIIRRRQEPWSTWRRRATRAFEIVDHPLCLLTACLPPRDRTTRGDDAFIATTDRIPDIAVILQYRLRKTRVARDRSNVQSCWKWTRASVT